MSTNGSGDGFERGGFEEASRPALQWLSRQPRWLLLLAVLGALVAGLFLRNAVGGVVLLVLAGFLSWLLALSWPVLSPGGRYLRLGTILLLAAAAGLRLVS